MGVDSEKLKFVSIYSVYEENNISIVVATSPMMTTYRKANCYHISLVQANLIILSRYRGRSNPVVRQWDWAQYRHMRHRSLGHVLQKGESERKLIEKYSIYNREERILDLLHSLFSLIRPLKHYQQLYT